MNLNKIVISGTENDYFIFLDSFHSISYLLKVLTL